jgi:hypothetical protein
MLLAELKRQGQQLQELQNEVRDGFRVALCRPEVRQLLDDVRQECSRPPDSEAGQARDPGICDTKKIQPAVISADPEHKGRFLKFMSLLRHEAMYMRSGSTTIFQWRRERVRRLVGQALLRNTIFLIVAHPVPGQKNPTAEAMNRAQAIKSLLASENNEIDDSRVMIWIYEFPVGKSEVDFSIDLPGPAEPPDLARSVWVFRADC